MQVPLEWLQQYVKVEASAQEVATKLTMGGLEVEGIEESALGPVLDVYITPNRGDCLSMVGVAREVAALYNLPLNVPEPQKSEPMEAFENPTLPSPSQGESMGGISVTIDASDLCPRYAARLVRGIKIGPSPKWMQDQLEAAGQRPINNVVDVTNYVMLELGQPLHAFDLDKLAGQRIVVRQARAGEEMTTLDGVERTLTPPMLVIADAEKAVAVAGVMGGAESEVSETTTNLLLESAHFNPLSVRRTSRLLALRTEASYRFERVVDPAGVRRAVDRACELLAQMGQPEAVVGVVDVYPQPIAGKNIGLRVRRAVELLGIPDITQQVAVNCLERLGFAVSVDNQAEPTVWAHVPPSRPDLTMEEDLIEEVGRIYGYENIPETLPVGATTRGGDSELGSLLARIRTLLSGSGLQEVVTHSLSAPSTFAAPDDAVRRVAIRNALSAEVGGLRRSLLPTMLDAAEANAARGQMAMGLFEVGRVWQNEETDNGIIPNEYLAVAALLVGPQSPSGWQKDSKPVVADFGAMRGVFEQLCAGLEIPLSETSFIPLGVMAGDLPQFHPGRSAVIYLTGDRPAGVIGEMHPRLAAKLRLKERIYLFEVSLDSLQSALPAIASRYQIISRFPSVSRDLAPRVPESLSYSEAAAAVRAADVELLETFKLTDVFRGSPLPEGQKSLTLSFTLRAPDRTLNEADVTDALAKIRTELETRCGATFAG